MKIIGIYEGHNCGCCLLQDGRITHALEEDRLSRIKQHDGRFDDPPELSLRWILEQVDPSEVDAVAIGVEPPWPAQKRVMADLKRQRNFRWNHFYLGYWDRLGPAEWLSPFVYAWWRQRRIRGLLRRLGLGAVPVEWYDHHYSHAASAYFLSGQRESTVVTLDGKGDGLSGSVYEGRDGVLRNRSEISKYDSIGYLYSIVTVGLGYRHMRHEGKITGLSAHGAKDNPHYRRMRDFFEVDGPRMRFTWNRGRWQPPYPSWCSHPYMWKKLEQDLGPASREDWSAAVQQVTEEKVVDLVQGAVRETGLAPIALAGGVFANVRVNQECREATEKDAFFVCPPMGDSGIAVGAACLSYAAARRAAGRDIEPEPVRDMYLGPEYSTAEMEWALRDAGLRYRLFDDVEAEIARRLADGKVVARFNGRIEFGPRALGNRSILYQASDPTVNTWLNQKLNRTEFMPFAPSTLYEDADRSYENWQDAAYAAEFMTITFRCTPYLKETCPAVVHIDDTARPQLVRREINPSYYRIIEEYKKLSGVGTIINTSFNMHEEPIVCTPADAVRAFTLGHLDVLGMGPFVAEQAAET